MPRALAAAVVLAMTIVVAAAPASADDRATKVARKHYDKGEKLFALGRFDDALVAYEAAFEAKPLPGFLFNIGQCHRNLGDYDAAIFSFKKYLKLDPDADNREAVLELIDELETARANAKVAIEPPPKKKPSKGLKPIYTRWWFWGGVVAVAGAGTGTYLLLRDDGVPDTDLGNVVFP